jgi:hypothetical protein
LTQLGIFCGVTAFRTALMQRCMAELTSLHGAYYGVPLQPAR